MVFKNDQFQNDQFQGTVIMVLLVIAATLMIYLLVAKPLPHFIILSLGSTYSFFRMFSGNKVKELFIEGKKIRVRKYTRLFKLEEHTYDIKSLYIYKTTKRLDETISVKRIYGENGYGKKMFVISTELFLWDDNDLDKIMGIVNSSLFNE